MNNVMNNVMDDGKKWDIIRPIQNIQISKYPNIQIYKKINNQPTIKKTNQNKKPQKQKTASAKLTKIQHTKKFAINQKKPCNHISSMLVSDHAFNLVLSIVRKGKDLIMVQVNVKHTCGHTEKREVYAIGAKGFEPIVPLQPNPPKVVQQAFDRMVERTRRFWQRFECCACYVDKIDRSTV